MATVSSTPSDSSPHGLSAIYTALDPHLPEIRVLKLLPSASFDAPLECRLVHRSLYDDAHGYEALSYVWGGSEFTAEIVLNNEPYFITPNLEMALRYLRRPSVERTLWVDALCINQHNLVERSQQVSLMKDIYARCTVDLAWMLTQENLDASELPARINKFHTGFELMQRLSVKDSDTLDRMSKGSPRSLEYMWDVGYRKFLLSPWEEVALIGAFGRTDVWYRIWTMQEFAYAPQLRLVAGPHELDWAAVAAFLGDRPYADAFHAEFGHRRGSSLRIYFSGAVRVHDQRRALCDENYTSTLLDVLARFQQNGATDPRDCVYGILGLVTDQHGIVVDYTKSTTQVFVDTAVSLMNAQQNLDTICQTAWLSRCRTENPHELPSWVPDFSVTVYNDAHMAILFAQRGIFAAGREYLNAPCRAIDNQFLPLRAVVLGCLRRDNTVQYTYGSMNSIKMLRAWLEQQPNEHDTKARVWSALGAPFDWLETSGLGVDILDGKIQYGSTGENAIRAYWRTLVMDCGAYPIKRLTEQETLQTDVAFRSILGFLNQKLGVSASEGAHERSMDTAEYCNQCIRNGEDDVSNETLGRLWGSMPETASTMWCRNYRNWTFSVTDTGLYTMVQDIMAGDTIVCVEGAKVPLVLRKRGSHDGMETYTLVGKAYVHGYMDGEALDLVDKGALHEEEILLQ